MTKTIDIDLAFTNTNGVVPQVGVVDSAGVDLVTHEDVLLSPFSTVKLDTGISMAIPKGYFGLIRPRSSAFAKGLIVQGTIDAGFVGTWKVVILNASNSVVALENGKSYAQVIFTTFATPNFRVVEALAATERGAGGWGSSGNTNLADKK